MTFRPLHNLVLIKQEEIKPRESGIIIPDSVQELQITGEVVATGPGLKDSHLLTIPMEVCIGNKVLFLKNKAAEIKVNNGVFLLIKETDIIGIIE